MKTFFKHKDIIFFCFICKIHKVYDKINTLFYEIFWEIIYICKGNQKKGGCQIIINNNVMIAIDAFVGCRQIKMMK